MTTTEAAVLIGPEKIEIQAFDLPDVGDDDGILEIEASGICGSDVEPYRNGEAKLGGGRVIHTPVILGHEMVGRIFRIGKNARDRWKVAEGDRVIVERWMPCGRCAACQSGRFASCYRTTHGEALFYGGTPTTVRPSLWGGLARHMYLHPDTVLHKVRADTPASVNSMFTPLGNAISWMLHTGGLSLGENLLIEGPGPIGLMCALIARRAGAQTVIVSGLAQDEQRLQLALELGATHTIEVGTDDVVARCKELTGADGIDLVLDVTGTSSLEPVVTAVGAVKANGRVVLATGHSGSGSEAEIAARIQDKELTVTGVRGRGRKAAAMALGIVSDPDWAPLLKRLCEPIVALEDIQLGFEAVISGEAIHASMSPSTSR